MNKNSRRVARLRAEVAQLNSDLLKVSMEPDGEEAARIRLRVVLLHKMKESMVQMVWLGSREQPTVDK